MPPLNLWSKFINGVYKKSSKDMGNALIALGIVGWVFSAAAQIGMICFSKNIDKKEKKFLIPQEVADGVINIGLNVTICLAIKKLADRLLEKGVFVTHRTNQLLPKFIKNMTSVGEILKATNEEFQNMNLFKKNSGTRVSNFYDGWIKILEGKGGDISKNIMEIITKKGIDQNKDKYLNQLKKGLQDYKGFKNGVGVIAAIGGSVLAASVITPFARNKAANYFQKRALDRGKVPIPKTSPHAVGLKTYPIAISNTFKGFGMKY